MRFPRGCAVSLFGRVCARDGGGTTVSLPGKRTEQLLAYLLVQRDRQHHREVLAGTLWPESSAAQSRKYLRQSLWQLRSLGIDDGLLIHDADWIRVDGGRLWLDVAELETAYAPVRFTPGEQLTAEQAAELKRVVPLYRGELLEGFYEDWCIYERERLKALYLSLLEKLLAYCEGHAEAEEGIGYGQELLRHDRAHERAHWRLMRLHCLAGNRTAALRQYELCRQALDEELQTVPGDQIRRLHRQIRAGEALVIQPLGRSGTLPGTASSTTPLEQALEALTVAHELILQTLDAARRNGHSAERLPHR